MSRKDLSSRRQLLNLINKSKRMKEGIVIKMEELQTRVKKVLSR